MKKHLRNHHSPIPQEKKANNTCSLDMLPSGGLSVKPQQDLFPTKSTFVKNGAGQCCHDGIIYCKNCCIFLCNEHFLGHNADHRTVDKKTLISQFICRVCDQPSNDPVYCWQCRRLLCQKCQIVCHNEMTEQHYITLVEIRNAPDNRNAQDTPMKYIQ